jgi:hypothetical protein
MGHASALIDVQNCTVINIGKSSIFQKLKMSTTTSSYTIVR